MTLFSTLAGKLFGGLAIALLLALGVQTVRLSSAQDARDKAIAARAMCEARHAITRQSVTTLESELAIKTRESNARADAFAAAANKAREASQDADRRFATTEARIAALRAAAGRGEPVAACRTPDDAIAALEGM